MYWAGVSDIPCPYVRLVYTRGEKRILLDPATPIYPFWTWSKLKHIVEISGGLNVTNSLRALSIYFCWCSCQQWYDWLDHTVLIGLSVNMYCVATPFQRYTVGGISDIQILHWLKILLHTTQSIGSYSTTITMWVYVWYPVIALSF